jgi:hypothetical protein
VAIARGPLGPNREATLIGLAGGNPPTRQPGRVTIARGPLGPDREAVTSEAAYKELTLDDIKSKKLLDYNHKSMMNYAMSTPGRFTQIVKCYWLLGCFNSP